MEPPGTQHGGHGGGGDVHHVVADEDGGQQLVIVLRQLQRPGGPEVSVVGPGFEPDAVERGEGCLCGGEIGGKSHQNDEGRKHTDTGTVKVHNKGINSAFYFTNFRLPWERFPRSIPYLFSDCNG